jgi:hypothetical protein
MKDTMNGVSYNLVMSEEEIDAHRNILEVMHAIKDHLQSELDNVTCTVKCQYTIQTKIYRDAAKKEYIQEIDRLLNLLYAIYRSKDF